MDTERLDDLDPRWARLTAALRGADPPDGLSPPQAALAAVLTAPTLTAAAAAANCGVMLRTRKDVDGKLIHGPKCGQPFKVPCW
jgi:hypothetical protein